MNKLRFNSSWIAHKNLWVISLFMLLGLFMPYELGAKDSFEKDEFSKTKYINTIDAYISKSRALLYEDAEQAIVYAQKALKLSKQIGDKKREADAYNLLGMGHYFEDDFKGLLAYYKKALGAYRSLGDTKSISQLSTNYFKLKQSEKAIGSYQKSIALYKEQGDDKNLLNTLQLMAGVYKDIGDYTKSSEYYQLAINLTEKSKQIEREVALSQLYGQKAEVLFLKTDYEEALQLFKKAKNHFKKLGDYRSISIIYSNIGNSFFYRGELDSALAAYSTAYKMQMNYDDLWAAAISLMHLGFIYDQLGMPPQAIKKHEHSISLAQELGLNLLLKDNYLSLSRIYEKQKDFEQAYNYRLLYADISETMLVDDNASKLVDVLALQELENQRKKNEILRAKNSNYQLQLEKKSLARWRMSLFYILLITFILGFIIIYRYYLKRNENKLLEERISEALELQKEQQQIIMHQSSLTSLGELAAGIAHEINQPIQNISLSAEGINYELEESDFDKAYLKQSVNEIFEDIHRARDIIDHIRLFSSGQKDEVFEEFSISDCVRSAMTMIGRQYQNHQIQLKLDLADDIPHVHGNPHKFEQVIYNLLSNAKDAVEERCLKEDGVNKSIIIRTYQKDKQLVLEVSDNGVGIDANRFTDIFLPFVTSKQLGKGTGLGLSISYTIIKEMGGSIQVKSEVGKGTSMFVILEPETKESSKK